MLESDAPFECAVIDEDAVVAAALDEALVDLLLHGNGTRPCPIRRSFDNSIGGPIEEDQPCVPIGDEVLHREALWEMDVVRHTGRWRYRDVRFDFHGASFLAQGRLVAAPKSKRFGQRGYLVGESVAIGSVGPTPSSGPGPCTWLGVGSKITSSERCDAVANFELDDRPGPQLEPERWLQGTTSPDLHCNAIAKRRRKRGKMATPAPSHGLCLGFRGCLWRHGAAVGVAFNQPGQDDHRA